MATVCELFFSRLLALATVQFLHVKNVFLAGFTGVHHHDMFAPCFCRWATWFPPLIVVLRNAAAFLLSYVILT